MLPRARRHGGVTLPHCALKVIVRHNTWLPHMTDKMISSTEQRAQIFALLRNNTPVEDEPVRPKYLDDNIADMMIGRAMSSFQTPVAVPEGIANQASHGTSRRPMHLTGQPAERFAS